MNLRDTPIQTDFPLDDLIYDALNPVDLVQLIKAQRSCDPCDFKFPRRKIAHHHRDIYGHSMKKLLREIEEHGVAAPTIEKITRSIHALKTTKRLKKLNLTSKRVIQRKNGKRRPIDMPSIDRWALCASIAVKVKDLLHERLTSDKTEENIIPILSEGICGYRSSRELKISKENRRRTRKKLAKIKVQDQFARLIYLASEHYPIALSIDLEDAFGRLPLLLLKEAIKSKLGLNDLTTDLLAQLVEINSLSLYPARTKHTSSKGEGIEQGNPLSPYLFNLAIDYALEVAQEHKDADKPTHKAPYFVYGDDIVLLYKTSEDAKAGWKQLESTFTQLGFGNLRPLGTKEKLSRIIDLREDHLSVIKTYRITRQETEARISLTPDKEAELIEKISQRVRPRTKDKVRFVRLMSHNPILPKGYIRQLLREAGLMREAQAPHKNNHQHPPCLASACDDKVNTVDVPKDKDSLLNPHLDTPAGVANPNSPKEINSNLKVVSDPKGSYLPSNRNRVTSKDSRSKKGAPSKETLMDQILEETTEHKDYKGSPIPKGNNPKDSDPNPNGPNKVCKSTVSGREEVVNTNPPSGERGTLVQGKDDTGHSLSSTDGKLLLGEDQQEGILLADLFQKPLSYEDSEVIQLTHEGWLQLLNEPKVKLEDQIRNLAGFRPKKTKPETKDKPSNCNRFILDLTCSVEYESHSSYKTLIKALLRASSVRGSCKVRIDPRSSLRSDLSIIGGHSLFTVEQEIYKSDKNCLQLTLQRRKSSSRDSRIPSANLSVMKAQVLGATIVLNQIKTGLSMNLKDEDQFGYVELNVLRHGERESYVFNRTQKEVNPQFAQLKALTHFMVKESSNEVIALPVKGSWSAYIGHKEGRTGIQHNFVTQIKRWTWTKQKGWWIGRPI